MRIALYHFLSAFFLLLLVFRLLVGGSLLAVMFGGMCLFFCYAIVAAVAGFGLWSLREGTSPVQLQIRALFRRTASAT